MNIWAHRGLSFKYPENTVTAFLEAARYDITGVELDIQLTRDGEIVVIHDETVDRTTEGTGFVKDFSLEELKRLKIRSEEYDLRIPTIKEVFDALKGYCADHGLLINIELKNSIERYPGMEEKIVDLVRQYDLSDNVLYSSFNFDSLKKLRELDEKAERGYLALDADVCISGAEKDGSKVIHPYVRGIRNKPEGYIVRAWNVRKEEPLYGENGTPCKLDLKGFAAIGVTDYITNNADLYAPLREKPFDVKIRMVNGSVDPETGLIVPSEKTSVNYEPLKVEKGMTIKRLNKEVSFTLYQYGTAIDDKLIYTYEYQPESNWASYTGCKDRGERRAEDIKIEEDGFFRITAGKPGLSSLSELIRCEASYRPEKLLKGALHEAKEVCESVDIGAANYLLLSDTHYSVNSRFEDSVNDIKLVAKRLPIKGILHLGDMTDGITNADICRTFTKRVTDALKSINPNLICAVGNHDSNYFRNNPEKIRVKEANAFLTQKKSGHYFYDDQEHRLRFIVLDSFDHTKEPRYGFSGRTPVWLKHALRSAPDGCRIIVLSHVPILSKIHIWSDTLRNEEKTVRVLERHNKAYGNILCAVCGHNHAEYIDNTLSFPVITIASNKVEECRYKKPEEFVVPKRRLGDISQDLFYILSVAEDGSFKIVRFGAGEGRRLV